MAIKKRLLVVLLPVICLLTACSADGENKTGGNNRTPNDGDNTQTTQPHDGKTNGNWPKNPLAALIPAPDFTFTVEKDESHNFAVAFPDASIAQLRAYTALVRQAGFNKEEDLKDYGGTYKFSALMEKDGKTYEAIMYFSADNAMLEIEQF